MPVLAYNIKITQSGHTANVGPSARGALLLFIPLRAISNPVEMLNYEAN